MDAQHRWAARFLHGAIIDALNQQFINQDVDFVIQVGDLVDVEVNSSGGRTLPTRTPRPGALQRRHRFLPRAGQSRVQPNRRQRDSGPLPTDAARSYGATNLGSPSISGLSGLSYAFDYDNVRCVLIDQFTRSDGSNYNNDSSNNSNAPIRCHGSPRCSRSGLRSAWLLCLPTKT